MSSLNKAIIIGHLGSDPEIRYTQNNTAVATLSVATNENYKDSNGEWQEHTEWHRVVAWKRLAEYAQQYIKKGSMVYLEGPIKTRIWEDNTGGKRYTTEITAFILKLLDSKTGTEMIGTEEGHREKARQPVVLPHTGDDFDDDLPF